MKNTSSQRWAAVQRIIALCPKVAPELDICLQLTPGRVLATAVKHEWLPKNGSATEHTGSDISQQEAFRDAVAAVVRIVRKQIADIEKMVGAQQTGDGDVRISAGLAKTLQVIESMQKNIEKAVDVIKDRDEDLLEIHRRIIGKIERAVQRGGTK